MVVALPPTSAFRRPGMKFAREPAWVRREVKSAVPLIAEASRPAHPGGGVVNSPAADSSHTNASTLALVLVERGNTQGSS